MNKEEGVPPRDDMPEQGIFDPETGRNITAEVYSESLQETDKALADAGWRAIRELVNGIEIGSAIDNARQEIVRILENHYFSMKLPVDEDRLADLMGRLGVVLIQYSSLLDDVLELKETAKSLGYSCDASMEPKLSFYFGWECPLDGINLTFSDAQEFCGMLLAVPYCYMKTNSYGPFFFGGEPPAAEILRAGQGGLIFVSQENAPPGDVLEALSMPRITESGLLPVTSAEIMGLLAEVALTDPACVDVAADPSDNEIKEIIFGERPEIMAIAIYTSGYPMKEIHPRHENVQFP